MRKRYVILLAVIVLVLAVLACDETTPVVRTAVPEAGEASPPASETPADTAPLGSSRSNPAPPGSAAEIGGMTIRILEAQRPADDVVAEANPYNDPPEEGNEYLTVTVEVTCNKGADDKCTFYPGVELSLVGSKGTVYDNEYIAGLETFGEIELFGGATKSGFMVYQCGVDETDLVLIYEEFIGFKKLYLALP